MNMMVSRRTLLGGLVLGGSAALLPRAALAWRESGAQLYPATHAFIKGFVDRRQLAGTLAAVGKGQAPAEFFGAGVQSLGDPVPVGTEAAEPVTDRGLRDAVCPGKGRGREGVGDEVRGRRREVRDRAQLRRGGLPLLDERAKALYDPTRFQYLGSADNATRVCISHARSKVATFDDALLHKTIMGASAAGGSTRDYANMHRKTTGAMFELVAGYKGTADIFLAMERGEVDGICESFDSIKVRRPDWIATKKISILFQGGAAPNPELKDVPFVLDFARTPVEKQALEFLYAGQGIGRPFVAPPELPAERLKMLRDAFNATMQDAEFRAYAAKSKLELEPEDGEHLSSLIAKIYATPKPIVDRITGLIK